MSWEDENYLQTVREHQECRELVDGGLKYIRYAACSLMITIFVGLVLFAFQRGGLEIRALGPLGTENVVWGFSLAGLWLIAATGFLAACLGLWRCLLNTPAFRNAKETMFLCVILFLIGTLVQLLSLFLGGSQSFLELHLHVQNWKETGRLPSVALLQLIGVGSYFLSFYAFNHYLLILHSGLNFQVRRTMFDLYLIFTSLLVGGFVGAYLSLDKLSHQPDLILFFLITSVINFIWFLFRLQSVRSLLLDNSPAPEGHFVSGVTLENTPKSLSGIRRVLKQMEK